MSCATWETRGKRSGRGKEKASSSGLSEDDVYSASEDAVGKTRSSPRHVSRVVAKFDAKKRSLVEAIGFGGILHVPQINKVNRKFSLWLFSRIDVEKRTLLLKDDIEITLSPANLEKVIGIPCGNKVVCLLEPIDEKGLVKGLFGIDDGSTDGLKEASSLVEKEYTDGWKAGHEMVFQSAFVMFVMGHFLAPTTQHDVVYTDFLGSIIETDEIAEYNLCDYVLKHLLSSAKKVEADMKEGKHGAFHTGCPLILQILYLDCMDFGPLNRNHDAFLRLRAFWGDDGTCKLINQIIQCNTASSSATGDQVFGCSKVRPLDTLCYEINVRPMWSTKTRAQMKTTAPKLGDINLHNFDSIRATSLSAFLKEKYNDQLSSELVDVLKAHNARCLQHMWRMKVSMLHENIALSYNILSIVLRTEANEGGHKPVRTPRDVYLSGPDSGSDGKQCYMWHDTSIGPDLLKGRVC